MYQASYAVIFVATLFCLGIQHQSLQYCQYYIGYTVKYIQLSSSILLVAIAQFASNATHHDVAQFSKKVKSSKENEHFNRKNSTKKEIKWKEKFEREKKVLETAEAIIEGVFLILFHLQN